MTRSDYSTITGIVFVFLILTITLSLNSYIINFFSFSAFLMVFCTTISICLASFSFKTLSQSFKVSIATLTTSPINPKNIAINCIKISDKTYKNGLRKFLNSEDNFITNEYFNKWSEYILDGEENNHIQKLINDEIETYIYGKKRVIELLHKASEIAPAFGLIGTILGLIQMLSDVQDSINISLGMSSALLTTLYGAILAYCIFLPISNKLENNLKIETINLRIIFKTICSINIKENPRMLEPSINTLLPDGSKIRYYKY